MIGEVIVQQILDMSEGKRINNKKKRDEQISKMLKMVNDFLERNPKYK